MKLSSVFNMDLILRYRPPMSIKARMKSNEAINIRYHFNGMALQKRCLKNMPSMHEVK